MGKRRQFKPRDISREPRYVVGMDAHTKKLSLSVWDWADRFSPRPAKEFRSIGIEEMETVYRRHIDTDSVTVIEATTNADSLKRRLEAAGYAAKVVRADTLAGKERRRKVCDIQDARNLARAYISGDTGDVVMTPSEQTAERRELLAAYRESVKETTRLSNRIWSLCTAKGLKPPKGRGPQKVAQLRNAIEEAGIGGVAKMRFEALADDYGRMWARRGDLERRIAEAVATTPEMRALMQLPGVAHRGAFALVAAVGDIHRFATPAKLAAYGGFAPELNTTGDEEERARRRGGTGKPLDGEGRRDLKDYFTEAGQIVMKSLPKSPLGRWGWSMFNRGKEWNKVVTAIGRKLLTYAWHILRGDPTPNRHDEEFFSRKMTSLHMAVGAKRMRELGSGTRKQFAALACEAVYGALSKQELESSTSENDQQVS